MAAIPQKLGPWLRLPQKLGARRTLAGRHGRPLDLAARELVTQLALAYLDATNKKPPKRVNSKRPGPFFRFVERVFEMASLPTGNVEELINEREKWRTQFVSQLDPEHPPKSAMEPGIKWIIEDGTLKPSLTILPPRSIRLSPIFPLTKRLTIPFAWFV